MSGVNDPQTFGGTNYALAVAHFEMAADSTAYQGTSTNQGASSNMVLQTFSCPICDPGCDPFDH